MPWVAMGFMTLYLQLLGFTDINAAMLVALFSLGGALGSFGGGYIGARTPVPRSLPGYSYSPYSAFSIVSMCSATAWQHINRP